MRMLLILIFAGFSLGAMATLDSPDTSAGTSTGRSIYSQTGTLTGAVAIVRKIKSHLSPNHDVQAWLQPSAGDEGPLPARIGDVVPEGSDLYEIPRHESYRYTVVEGHRVIVDAASRQIVYILQ